MPLFNRVNDRQQTQLAYKIKYFPYDDLSQTAKDLIPWKHHTYIKKIDIELHCNETKEAMYYKGRLYRIVWAYNSIPTEAEWNKRSDQELIRCEFRYSPAIPEGKIILLSFWQPAKVHGAPL